mgnify:CR=1 FL=1
MTDTFYSVADFVSIMGEAHPRLLPAISEVAATWPDTAMIRALTYDYATLDEHNQPITMSALMLLPYVDGAMTARTLWLENRATQSADKNVPTRRWNIGEAHVLSNHVLVSPDLMSFGASIDRPICYCHSVLAARNTVDAVLAAENMLLREFALPAPLPVINSGHSQGGFDALAVHRYMETAATEQERALLPLVRTFCADGPYVPDVLTRIVAARDKYLYGAYMVMNAMSHLVYHNECFTPDITIADFLTPAARELGIAETIARKEEGNSELVKMVIAALGLRTDALFVPEVYQEGGRLYEMLMRCSERERLIDGWEPALPVSFYHAHEDECVPVECMQAVEEAWGHLPNVTFEDDMTPATDIPNRMVHAYSGGVFHRRLLTDKKL